MESKTNYFIVGSAVLLLTAGLIIAALWLSVGFNEKTYTTYTVYMRETVSGLNNESPVKYNGVKVGLITNIELNKADPQEVKLQVDVEEGTPITISTQATLVSQGITGTTYLGLASTSSSTTPLVKKPGELYPVIPYKPSFFNQLEKSITELTAGINRIFDKENSKNVKQSLANIHNISDIIVKNNNNLDQTLQSLPKLVDELKKSVVQFNIMSHDISAAGLQLSETMHAGRNVIDRISQQAIPPTVLMLRRLDLITANLEKVSAQMRQNPAVIIRGSAPPATGPGE